MRHFKSLEEIRGATLEQLLKIPELNERAARSILEFFAEERRAEEPEDS